MRQTKISRKNIVYIASIAIGCLILINIAYCRRPHKDDKSEELANIVNDWIGKELYLPDNVGRFTTNGDSSDMFFPKEKFTILRYIDKKGCTTCRLHLNIYPGILSELSDSANCKVGFVCIINPMNMKEIRSILHSENSAGLTMWIDETDTLNAINHFPDIDALRTFLIDDKHRVLAVGDPAINPRVMKLFNKIITNDTINTAHAAITKLSVEQEEIQLGNVAAGDTITRSVILQNVGAREYILDKVVTSCDCTTAELSPERIAPGGRATLRIRFSESEATGDFFRTIDVFGNTSSPVTIELSGKII